MKKIYILFLLNLFIWNSFCEPVEFSSAVYFTVPAGKDNKTVKDNSKLKYNYGLRLNFPSATITGNAKLASTEFKDIGTYTFNDYISKQEYTYGINQSLKAGKIKFNISAGTLHYSGAISRLKNPAFSCPEPLKKFSLFTQGISAQIPSPASSKTPVSFAASITPESESHLPSMQFAILKTKEKYGAVFKRFTTPIIPQLVMGFTAGTFFHEHTKETTWFMIDPYYNEEEFFSSEFITALMWKPLKMAASAGLYENPFGGRRGWIKNQSYFSYGSFSFGLYYFNSDDDLITSSGNKPRIRQQIFFSPQIQFPVASGILNIGSTIGQAKRKTKQRKAEPYNYYYGRLGASFTSMTFTLKGKYSIDYSTEDKDKKQSYNLNLISNFSSLHMNTSYTFSIDENNLKKHKVSESVSIKKGILNNVSTYITWTEKNTSNTINLNTSINLLKRNRHLLFRGKISLALEKDS